MLSSLASFIPNALRDTARTTSFRPDNEEVQTQEVQQPPPEPVEPSKEPASRKKEKERRVNEVFVVVRPPPSKTNHPLNLQVQLVPPHSRGVLPRQSIDSDLGAPLRRSTSTRSQESSTTYGSTSSFASTVSTPSSSSSSRRAIVPLYNLQAHNVLPNIIVDAGTDAKIAKFQKRGIELIDLALLEPVEVWHDPNAVIMPVAAVTSTLTVPMVGPGASTSTLGRLSVDEMGLPQVSVNAGSASRRSVPTSLAMPVMAGTASGPYDTVRNTETSSNASLSSASHGVHQASHSMDTGTQETPPNSAALAQSNSRRNIFGKIFKRAPKDSSTPPDSPSIPSSATTLMAKSAGLRQPPSARLVDPSSQPATPRPESAQLQTQGSLNESCDQSGTPTQMQHMVTPMPPHHPQMSPKDSRLPSSGGKRASGLRGSWLIGSPTSSQRSSQSVSSPLAAAFSSISSLGAKRRSQINSGQTVESPTTINLTGANEDSLQTATAQIHTGVSQMQLQPLSQLCSAVLGIQPAMVLVPTSFSSRSYRGRKSKSPNGEKRRSAEDDPNETRTKPAKEKGKSYRRPYMYAWLVRKWMKRRPPPPASPSGYGHDHKGFGLGLQLGGIGAGLGVHIHRDRELGVEEIVEVRFEWRRAPMVFGSKKKLDAGASNEAVELGTETEDRRRQSRERRSRDNGSQRKEGEVKVTRKEDGFDAGSDERVRKPSASSIASARAAVKRWSLISYQSQSTTGASEEADGQADTGDESDPEDSETPWVCTLKVRRTNVASVKETELNLIPSTVSPKGGRGHSRRDGGGVGEEGKEELQSMRQEVLRIKVGTLSPTPHHPKVVAMLKVPFPLPDVQVERLGVLKRRGLAPSSQQGGDLEKEDYYGLTLTAEEIKDIVCSTGLWLVVRESIGGVGKVQRKGDGWMIRS